MKKRTLKRVNNNNSVNVSTQRKKKESQEIMHPHASYIMPRHTVERMCMRVFMYVRRCGCSKPPCTVSSFFFFFFLLIVLAVIQQLYN